MTKREESPTELIFGTDLVNTSDATVTRISGERAALARAMTRAENTYWAAINAYKSSFVDRVTRILVDVEVELPALPPIFQENTETPS